MLQITLDGGTISALLVTVSTAVLVVVTAFVVWAKRLQRRIGSRTGHTLLSLLLRFGQVSLVFQFLTLINANLIAYDRTATVDLRAALFLGQEVILLVAVLWAFRFLRGL